MPSTGAPVTGLRLKNLWPCSQKLLRSQSLTWQEITGDPGSLRRKVLFTFEAAMVSLIFTAELLEICSEDGTATREFELTKTIALKSALVFKSLHALKGMVEIPCQSSLQNGV